MSKITEPAVATTMTDEERALYDARTLRGLDQAERGEGSTVEAFRLKMEARIADAKSIK